MLREGIYYRPLCSPQNNICVVAAESRNATLVRTQRVRDAVLLVAALLGDTLVLAVILLYRRYSSQGQQLCRALRRGSLKVVYQPIVRVDTGAVIGAEALVRWVNEEGEDVRPESFIALAEREGFVTEITRFVLSCAIEELADLLTSGKFRLTINVTSEDLADQRFFNFLQLTLKSAHVTASVIGLELTERSTTRRCR